MRLEYFEMLDRIEELDLAAGTVLTTSTLPTGGPVLESHFPKFPILPGVLMLEIMNHAAGIVVYYRMKREKFVFLGGIKRAKFRRMVRPGAVVQAKATITHDGSGFSIAETALILNGEVAADAEIILIVQDFPSPEAAEALRGKLDSVAFAEAARV